MMHARTVFGATILAAAVTVLTAPVVQAEDEAEPKREWLAESGAPLPLAGREEGPSPWRIGAMFLLVGGLGAAAVYAKRAHAKNSGLPNAPSLSVVGAARVGNKAQLVLTSVAGKLLLVGVTENSVRKLAWIEPDEPKATGRGRANRFDSLLDGLLTNPTHDEAEEEEDAFEQEDSESLAMQRPEPARSSPALDIASRMRDRFEASVPRDGGVSSMAQEPARPRTSNPSAPKRDIEGQARGLRRRKAKRS